MSEYRNYISILNETTRNVNSMWKDSNGEKFLTVFLNPVIDRLSNIDWSIDRLLNETDDAIEILRRYEEV